MHEGRRVVWKLPVYSTIHKLLTNPIYGGAYAFGRTGSRITPGQLGECFADGYRDARRRARAQTAFYGSLTTVSLVAAWVIVPALTGGDDFSDYYR